MAVLTRKTGSALGNYNTSQFYDSSISSLLVDRIKCIDTNEFVENGEGDGTRPGWSSYSDPSDPSAVANIPLVLSPAAIPANIITFFEFTSPLWRSTPS